MKRRSGYRMRSDEVHYYIRRMAHSWRIERYHENGRPPYIPPRQVFVSLGAAVYIPVAAIYEAPADVDAVALRRQQVDGETFNRLVKLIADSPAVDRLQGWRMKDVHSYRAFEYLADRFAPGLREPAEKVVGLEVKRNRHALRGRKVVSLKAARSRRSRSRAVAIAGTSRSPRLC